MADVSFNTSARIVQRDPAQRGGNAVGQRQLLLRGHRNDAAVVRPQQAVAVQVQRGAAAGRFDDAVQFRVVQQDKRAAIRPGRTGVRKGLVIGLAAGCVDDAGLSDEKF